MSTQHLCDVHLQCLDGSIPFSWYLLSEYSYFASAYQHIEGEKGLIECKFSMSIMNVLCHYMRFKQLPEIKADEITTLMTAADYYSMTELLPLLCQYITHHPSVEGLSCWLQMLTKVGTARDLEIATLNFILSGQDPNNLPRSLFTAPNLIVDLLLLKPAEARLAADWYLRYGPAISIWDRGLKMSPGKLGDLPFVHRYLGKHS